jgi:hypothetical protein
MWLIKNGEHIFHDDFHAPAAGDIQRFAQVGAATFTEQDALGQMKDL